LSYGNPRFYKLGGRKASDQGDRTNVAGLGWRDGILKKTLLITTNTTGTTKDKNLFVTPAKAGVQCGGFPGFRLSPE
jgi:hypothetical protein